MPSVWLNPGSACVSQYKGLGIPGCNTAGTSEARCMTPAVYQDVKTGGQWRTQALQLLVKEMVPKGGMGSEAVTSWRTRADRRWILDGIA